MEANSEETTMDALDVRLCEIADQCKTEAELARLQRLALTTVMVWRNEVDNAPVNKTSFTYEQFMNDEFGDLLCDIRAAKRSSFDSFREKIKRSIVNESKKRRA